MNHSMHNQRGYTLLEIIIATGILVMLLTIATSVLTRYFAAQRVQIAQQALQEDIRFAIELMTREIRTGYGSTFILPDSTGRAVTLRNQNGVCVEYRLNTATKQLERAEVNAAGDLCEENVFAGASFAAITSQKTIVDFIRFDPVRSSTNAEGFPDRQGIITISVIAKAKEGSDIDMRLQTTAASRQVSIFQQ